MKINWWMISFIALAVAIAFREGCRCGKGEKVPVGTIPKTTHSDTVIVIDTQYIPKPYMVVVDKRVQVGTVPKIVTVTDTVEVPVIVEVSEGTAYYRDSLPVSHGYAIIQDTVSENRIQGRNFKLFQTLPVLKETVQAKERNVLYLGLSGSGGKDSYLYSVEGNVSLKVKGGQIFTAGAGLTKDNQVLFRGGVMWPVRLRR